MHAPSRHNQFFRVLLFSEYADVPKSRGLSAADERLRRLYHNHADTRLSATSRSRWARCGNIMLADLAGEPWILPPSLAVKTVLEKAFQSIGLIAPSPVVSASSIQLLHKLLATGRFLSVLATSLLQTNAKQWKIKALPIELPKPPPVAVFTLKNRTLSPAAQLFIEQLRAVAKSMSIPPEQRQR